MEFDSTKVEKPMGRMLALQQAMPGVKFLLWCSRADIHEKVRQYLEEHSALSHSGHHYEAEVIAEDKDCIVVYENFSGVKPWIRDAFFPGEMTAMCCCSGVVLPWNLFLRKKPGGSMNAWTALPGDWKMITQ